MGVFNFGDPTNRRPAWHADAWPKRRGARGVVDPGNHPAAGVKPVESTPTDGLAATRQIRRFELERSRPRVPIVAYTSGTFDTLRLRLQDFGIDGLLAKPCAANELHECLLRWCPAAAVPAAFADIRHGDRD